MCGERGEGWQKVIMEISQDHYNSVRKNPVLHFRVGWQEEGKYNQERICTGKSRSTKALQMQNRRVTSARVNTRVNRLARAQHSDTEIL